MNKEQLITYILGVIKNELIAKFPNSVNTKYMIQDYKAIEIAEEILKDSFAHMRAAAFEAYLVEQKRRKQ